MKRVSKDKETNWKGRTVVFRGLAAWFARLVGNRLTRRRTLDLCKSIYVPMSWTPIGVR